MRGVGVRGGGYVVKVGGWGSRIGFYIVMNDDDT